MTYCISNKKGEILGVRKTKREAPFWSLSSSDKGSVTVLFTANTKRAGTNESVILQ